MSTGSNSAPLIDLSAREVNLVRDDDDAGMGSVDPPVILLRRSMPERTVAANERGYGSTLPPGRPCISSMP